MPSELESGLPPGSEDPYLTLGLDSGATFDEVQKAKEEKLKEVGDNSQAKAKIESSYEAILMSSLKQRQLGKVSSAAANASRREDVKVENRGIFASANNFLNQSKNLNTSDSVRGQGSLLPQISIVDGQGLIVRLVLGGSILLLLLVSTDKSVDLLLALSTIGLFVSQIRRGRRPLPSLGWSVVLLSLGLMMGAFLLSISGDGLALQGQFSNDQLEGLPAVVILWIGSLLLN